MKRSSYDIKFNHIYNNLAYQTVTGPRSHTTIERYVSQSLYAGLI